MRHSTVALLLIAAGCSSPSAPIAVSQRSALESFSGQNACAELETYIENTAVAQMRYQLEEQRDSRIRYATEPQNPQPVAESLDATTTAGAPSDSANAESDAPTDFTTTNNQVANVDEADFMKNDGTRIFVLSGNKLHALKSWPASEASVQGSIAIDGWPRELFLDGSNTAVVFSAVHHDMPDFEGGLCNGFAMSCGYSSGNTTKVTVIDVSDLSSLKEVTSYEIPGNYYSARKIDSSIRMVLTDSFRWPKDVRFYPDDSGNSDWYNNVAEIRARYDGLIASNEALIRAQSLKGWVREDNVDCTQFSKVNAPTRLGMLTVATLNLESSKLDRETIMSEPAEVYASSKNLYLATRHWWWWNAPGQEDATYVHKFDISSPDEAKYVASGTIPGHIVDQFSMDENAEGFFRIVTTISRRVPDLERPQNVWGRTETTSRLWVYAENDGRLIEAGKTEELAKGERVMSSRFLGNKAFVVTFRQVDPLFTFDLTDPAQPKKIGELKIPGFSTYLHPLDDTHLLTIGTYIPEPVAGQATDWRARALQLAIFDVSDLSNPVQTHTQLVGTAYGWSEAQNEHKAFNYFASKKLLAIPFYSYDWADGFAWSRFTSDLRVFSVDVDTGFTSRGAVTMTDLYSAKNYYGWSYYYTPAVRRSVMADDYVYAVSDAGVRVSHIDALATPLATASFDAPTE